MSVGGMAWVFKHSCAAPTERLVLLAIADCANDRGEAWPSMAALVEKTRLSERTVQRAVANLVDLGELASVVGGGRGKTTKYRLIQPARETPSEKPRQRNPVTESKNPVTVSENPVTVTPGTIKNRQEPKKTPTGSSSGTRIPDDFAATADMIAWARRETPLVGAKETEKFVDYWRARPGAAGRKTDWVATWRNWMRKAQADAEGAPARASPNGLIERNGMRVRPETAARLDDSERWAAMDAAGAGRSTTKQIEGRQ